MTGSRPAGKRPIDREADKGTARSDPAPRGPPAPAGPIPAAWDWLRGRPYLLLTLTTLMWAGNGVASRLAVGEVSPMALVTLRWVVVVAIDGFAVRRSLLADWPVLALRWRFIA